MCATAHNQRGGWRGESHAPGVAELAGRRSDELRHVAARQALQKPQQKQGLNMSEASHTARMPLTMSQICMPALGAAKPFVQLLHTVSCTKQAQTTAWWYKKQLRHRPAGRQAVRVNFLTPALSA